MLTQIIARQQVGFRKVDENIFAIMFCTNLLGQRTITTPNLTNVIYFSLREDQNFQFMQPFDMKILSTIYKESLGIANIFICQIRENVFFSQFIYQVLKNFLLLVVGILVI